MAELPEGTDWAYEHDAMDALDEEGEKFAEHIDRTAVQLAFDDGRNVVTVKDVQDAVAVVTESKYPPPDHP